MEVANAMNADKTRAASFAVTLENPSDPSTDPDQGDSFSP
jgi:hypothetical protein